MLIPIVLYSSNFKYKYLQTAGLTLLYQLLKSYNTNPNTWKYLARLK